MIVRTPDEDTTDGARTGAKCRECQRQWQVGQRVQEQERP